MNLIKKIVYIIALFVFTCTLFSSCATMLNGKHQKVTIQTDPPGAVVSNGKKSYITPATIQLERKTEHRFTVIKPGYVSQSVVFKKVPSGAVAGNIIMPLSILWIGVDIANGANFKLVPEKMHIKLQQNSFKKQKKSNNVLFRKNSSNFFKKREVVKAVDTKSKDLKAQKNL